MNEKSKHLEFIQAIVTRMGQNSFLIKGWTITLVSALFVLSAKDTNQKFIYIVYLPLLIFWGLDSYYLNQERLFRKLYDHVRQQQDSDYSLSTASFDNGLIDWFSAGFAGTIRLFYGTILLTLIILTWYIKS